MEKIKAIIVAAGQGSRLGVLTENLPKTLLKVKGKTILSYILESLRSCNINDIVIVQGYKRWVLNIPDIIYCDNDEYFENNILESLFYAEKYMKDGFIFSYSDIIYSKEIVQKLLESPYDISLVVDTDWKDRYKNRDNHPTDQAELVYMDNISNRKITRISKFFNPETAHGEFIGLAKFSKKGAEIIIRNYHRSLNWYKGRFQDATSIRKAYLTDMIQELILRGYPVHIVDIQKGWVEIDTLQDLEYAENLIGVDIK